MMRKIVDDAGKFTIEAGEDFAGLSVLGEGNQAIIDAILDQQPASFWDLGCGEGWLAREIGSRGIKTLGTDVISDLLEIARQKDPNGSYEGLAYEGLDSFSPRQSFEVICCNFSLIGKESVDHIFTHISSC